MLIGCRLFCYVSLNESSSVNCIHCTTENTSLSSLPFKNVWLQTVLSDPNSTNIRSTSASYQATEMVQGYSQQAANENWKATCSANLLWISTRFLLGGQCTFPSKFVIRPLHDRIYTGLDIYSPCFVTTSVIQMHTG